MKNFHPRSHTNKANLIMLWVMRVYNNYHIRNAKKYDKTE